MDRCCVGGCVDSANGAYLATAGPEARRHGGGDGSLAICVENLGRLCARSAVFPFLSRRCMRRALIR